MNTNEAGNGGASHGDGREQGNGREHGARGASPGIGANANTTAVDSDAPLELGEMAELMRSQQRKARSGDARIISVMLLIWGIVWFVGFTILWSGETGGNPWFRIPTPIDALVFAALMIVGVAASVTMGIQLGRGMRGDSATSGTMYGVSWIVAMMGASTLLGGYQRNGLEGELLWLVAPAIFVSTVGIMYLVGAAIWRSWPLFFLGASTFAIACVATFVGTPHHSLAYAIGSIVVLPLFAWWSWRSMLIRGDAGDRSATPGRAPATGGRGRAEA
ncbi:MAG: hypothetical protein ACTH31_07180 [Pseudoclavibacter sp.]